MRLAHGRTGWALAAASSLGIGLASAHQPPPVEPPAPPAAGKVPAALASSEEEGRLAQIKVELAWLTDPLTFPCDLAVRAVAGGVEVGGDVPREEVRVRAIALARKHGKVPVLDRIVVRPGSAPSAAVRPSLLSSAVEAALNKVMIKHAGDDAIYNHAIDSTGQITVSGTAFSCEEKLSISRKLSQITGCTSVVNQFSVKPLNRDGKVFTPITKDGRLVVAGDPAEVIPTDPGFIPPAGIVALPPSTGAVAAATPAATPSAPFEPTPPTPSWPVPTPAALPPSVPTVSAAPPPAWPADASSVPVGPLTSATPVAIKVEASAALPPPTPVPAVSKVESPLSSAAPKPVASTLPSPTPVPAGPRIESPMSGAAPRPVASTLLPPPPVPGAPRITSPMSGPAPTVSANTVKPAATSSPYGGAPLTGTPFTQAKPVAAASPGSSPYGGMVPPKPATDLPAKPPVPPVVQTSKASPYGGAWQPPAPKPELNPTPPAESPFAHAPLPKPPPPAKPSTGDLDLTSSTQTTPRGPLTPTPPAPAVVAAPPPPVPSSPYLTEKPAAVAVAAPRPVAPSPYVAVKPGTLVQPPPPPSKFVAIVRPPESTTPSPEVKAVVQAPAAAPPAVKPVVQAPVAPPEVKPVVQEAVAPPMVIQASATAPEEPPVGPPLLPPPDEPAPVVQAAPEVQALPAPRRTTPRVTVPILPPVQVADARPVPFKPLAAPTIQPTVAPRPVVQAPPPAEKLPAPLPAPTTEKPLRPAPILVPVVPTLSDEHAVVARKIQLTCAAKGADVQVRFPESKTCSVRIRLADHVAAVRLAQEVMHLPELVPYKVNLDVPKPPGVAVAMAPAVPAPTPVAPPPAYAPPTGASEPNSEQLKEQSRIRKEVKKLCGDQVEEVHVRFPGGHKAIVQLKPHSEEVGKALTEKILALDDLEGYEVTLDMPVAPKIPSVVVPEPTVVTSASPSAPSKPVVTAERRAKTAAVYPSETVVQAGAKEVPHGEAKPSGAKAKADPARVTNRVLEVCGMLAKDVGVQFHGDKECVVRFKTRTEGEARLLGEKILNLAELEPYEVKLELTIEP